MSALVTEKKAAGDLRRQAREKPHSREKPGVARGFGELGTEKWWSKERRAGRGQKE